MAYDEPLAEATLSQAFALYPAESVLVDILQRGLSAIGDAWYAGAARHSKNTSPLSWLSAASSHCC